MTIASTTSKVSYNGSGSTGPFPITFKFTKNADITATKRASAGTETVLTLTTDYTLTGAGDASGGALTLTAALAVGESLVIARTPGIVQEVDYVENSAFPAETHEAALDLLTMICQSLQEQVDRSVKVEISSTTDPDDLLAELAADVVSAAASAATATTQAGTATTKAGEASASAAASAAAADSISGFVNVQAYGADPTGVASSVTAFQAAVDATTDGAIAVVFVPSGTYAGAMAGLSVGTRTMIWLELGAVTFSTSYPPGFRAFTKYAEDTGRIWFAGNTAIATTDSTGAATDKPTLRIQRTENHTGGTPGVFPCAISSQSQINNITGVVDSSHCNTVIELDNYRADPSSAVQPVFTGLQLGAFKKNADNSALFGSNFVARDETKLGAANSKGSVVATEIDVVASGPDAGESRLGVDVVARGYDASADGATSVYCGVRVRTANNGVLSSEPVALQNGILVSKGTIGSIGTGLNLNGPMTTHARIKSDDSASAIIKHGSARSTNGTITAQQQYVGHNASDAEIVYAYYTVDIGAATAGAESGVYRMYTRRAGTATQEFGLNGGMILGAPTGTYKGVGTLNATAVYDDNVLLTCYVIEHWLNGSIDLDFWDAIVADREIPAVVDENGNEIEPARVEVRNHERARGFAPVADDRLDIDKYVEFMRTEKRLPTFPGPEKWGDVYNGNMPTGDLIQRLWETVEVQAVHIAKLNERLKVLEIARQNGS